jgi:hypothetical protein
MTRSPLRQSSLGCRLMIALAILGAGFAPLCDADRAAQTVIDETLTDTCLPDALVDTGWPSEEATNDPAPADDTDRPSDDESFDYATATVLLVEVRANPRLVFPSVWPNHGLALAPRRALITAPSAPPRATDLPTRLCRWTC